LDRLSAGTDAIVAAIVSSRAWSWAAVAIGAAAAVDGFLRLSFLHVGLSPDEGGYAYVAQQWARGARLYGPAAWVDRPQGLMLAYRFLLSIAHGAWAIRLGALVCGVAITVLLGAIGWMLDGPWTGAAAAAIYAIVGISPHVQGFTFNGELAAALPATVAVASALAWRRTRRSSWLVVAGVAGAAGLLMKQSGFDGLVVAGAVVASCRWRRRRNLAVFGAAFLAPVAASGIDGAISGWSGYWFAVVGYKLSAHSGADAGVAGRLGRLATSWLRVRPDLELLVLAALAGVGFTLLGRRRTWLPTGWLLAAFAGFNMASLYWPHYYVQLIPPLALLAAVTATSVAARSKGAPALGLAVAVVAAIVWPVLPYLIRVSGMTPGSKRALVPYYEQYATDQRVAAAVRKLSRPRAPIYALDSEADLYYLAGRRAAFPYLWAHPLDEIPGALERLRTLLDSPRHPPLVIIYRKPDRVDPTGQLGRILHDDYRFSERVPSTDITILHSSSA
jgi:4-amino-4-deoxy-L-arabinose transferase-like glycosyltransferase